MSAYAVFITHRTKLGQRSEAAAVWDRLMRPAVTANPDHVVYVYTLPDDEPEVIRAFQLYRTAHAAAAFLRTSEYLAYIEAVARYLDGPPHVVSGPATWIKA